MQLVEGVGPSVSLRKNLNVHYRVAIPDSVFTHSSEADKADFRWLPDPAGVDTRGMTTDHLTASVQ